MEGPLRSIIAMKGAPFTRKTEYATVIGGSLRCPVLSVEDVLEVLPPDYLQTCLSSNTTTPQSLLPQDLAFQITCQMTKSHLSKGISENVVIDSPLSSRSHLNQLIELARSLGNTRLVIVECKPENKYSWKLEFQHWTDKHDETQKWYKAKNWDDVEKAIKEDSDESSGGYKVSKLVIDPLLGIVENGIFCVQLLGADSKSLKPSPFIEAVKYMINRIEDDSTDHIVLYDKWKQSQQLHSGTLNIEERKLLCCKDHTITNYTEEAGLGYKANCTACGNQVMAKAYSCKNCSLALHKDCAESFDPNQKRDISLMHGKIAYVDHRRGILVTRRTFNCISCKKDTFPCATCLFETHLILRLTPTIIRHVCEDHFLCILPPLFHYTEAYRCAACGKSGKHGFYSCRICNVAYHFRCLTLPSQVKHEHGGHHHHMQLKFSSEEAEDYMCDVCVGNSKDWYLRDPRFWFYSCQECPFEAHLSCVT